MKKLNELETELRDKRKALQELLELREKESREFTADEATRFDTTHDAIDGLIKSIEREKKAEDHRKQVARDNASRETSEQKVAKRFSFHRAMQFAFAQRSPDGVEAEMHSEAVNESKSAGLSLSFRGIAVPGFMMNIKGPNVHNGNIDPDEAIARAYQQRDLTVGGAATGAELVPTEMIDHIYGLRIQPKVIQLGATVMQGLTGNVEMSKSGVANASFKTEVATADELTPSTAKISMSPKRLPAYTDVSISLLNQRPGIAEGIARTELQSAIDRELDRVAINGSGIAPEPLGVLNLVSNLVTAMGTDGATPTRTKLIAMRKALAAANSDALGMPKWLTTPGIQAYLMNLAVDAGSGRFVWPEERDALLGLAAFVSNNVPSTLTKGASTSICHAIILAQWEQLLIGQWGGMEILVNPYTKAKEGTVEFVINTYWDVDARHDQAFSVMKDALEA